MADNTDTSLAVGPEIESRAQDRPFCPFDTSKTKSGSDDDSQDSVKGTGFSETFETPC